MRNGFYVLKLVAGQGKKSKEFMLEFHDHKVFRDSEGEPKLFTGPVEILEAVADSKRPIVVEGIPTAPNEKQKVTGDFAIINVITA